MCSDLPLNWWTLPLPIVCRLTRLCASEASCSQNYWFYFTYPLSTYFLHIKHMTLLYVYNLRHSVRVYIARLQFVPYPPACHVRGLLVRPWVVPRGTSSIVPGSSGTLHHCPAPSTRCFPDPVVSNYFICRLPQFSQTAVKWRSLPVLLSLLTRPRHACTSCGGRLASDWWTKLR